MVLPTIACPTNGLHPTPGPFVSAVCPGVCRHVVRLTFLGTAGFVIRSDDLAILTPPLFSRPNLGQVLDSSHFVADTAAIARAVEEHGLGDDLMHVRAVLVGHSHYDHLMDVPFIAERYAPRAIIYGSPTMGHILAGDKLLRPIAHTDSMVLRPATPSRVVVIDSDFVGDAADTGKWIYVDDDTSRVNPDRAPTVAFRFMAIRSAHGPNFGNYTLAPGILTSDLPRLPQEVKAWKLGEVFAYLIDLVDMRDSSVIFRIYFRDAVGRTPNGFPPQAILVERPLVDVAIICGGNFENTPNYPNALLDTLRPTWTLVGHWEDFFQTQSSDPPPIPLMKTNELARRLNASMTDSSAWMTPEPYARLRFCICR